MTWNSRIVGWTVALVVFLAAGIAVGQTLDRPKTTFREHGQTEGADVLFEDADVGGFGGPEFKLSSVVSQPGMLLGGRGGVLINHVLAIGGGGYGLVNSPKPGTTIGSHVASIGLGYGGVFFEGILLSDAVVHPTVGAMFAGGGARYEFESRDQTDISTSIFVIDSYASAEVNLTEFARVLVGVDYRAVFGVDLTNLGNADLSGPGAHMMLKVGVF